MTAAADPQAAHHWGRLFHTSICCWVLGYAKEKHPDAAARQDIRCRLELNVQAHMQRCVPGWSSTATWQGECPAAAPVTVSRLQLRPSVRITYRSALRGHSSTLRAAHAVALGSYAQLLGYFSALHLLIA